MNILPTDLVNIINDYLIQLNLTEKYNRCVNEIKTIKNYSISYCKNCRQIFIKKDLDYIYTKYNNISCNHDFILYKPLYKIINREKFIKSNPFLFYCLKCNKYDTFFDHLHI